ncbi:MAG: hypothetical protein OXH11_20335, partial [Candidatus Aminicenantes bacterium]|nr:hypothetical protein [Candidatus Aminicenantes bacterium]
ERTPDKREVSGSNPLRPTIFLSDDVLPSQERESGGIPNAELPKFAYFSYFVRDEVSGSRIELSP